MKKGNSGKIVRTRSGKTGRVYNSESIINGKVAVHTDDGQKILCNPNDLSVTGFFD